MLEENEIENWRDEHGQPDFKYLQSLVSDGSIEAINKIKSIAEDLDVNFNETTPVEELIGMIRMATKSNEDSNPGTTN